MALPKITLYIDIVSPFAYIAFHNSPTFAKCEVTYVPILLGGLMNSCSNTPPIEIKNKNKWVAQERLRWAKFFAVPMSDSYPQGFPPRTLTVQRALCAVSQKSPAKLPAVIDALYHSFWVNENFKIGEPETFAPILESILGKQVTQDVLSAVSHPEVKALLLSNTDETFKQGAFGLPWFQCTNAAGETEGFWGVDHLGVVANFLGLDRSQDPGFKAVL
ncbi:thioredoxin-like protein [Penicillium macrosclerotiorum]|uniref:thioredoxin-like protein n=1 Tax=Penicillium macrosclerotiorum TaxID=303699 RepID=UPI0025472C1E|nr:thioredoxin-like protein [Penicillium macrosclerotiorum]KAJ5675609.1 thioredoxin-like protein [Penicillium macrosclerotiorum]